MPITRVQIQLGSNVYGNSTTQYLLEGPLPDYTRTIIQHEVPMALNWPQKDLGPKPPVLSGKIFLPEADIPGFENDVGNVAAGERQLTFWWAGAISIAYVKTGTCNPTRFSSGLGMRMIVEEFTFMSTRTAIYASDGVSIRRGGS